MATTLLTELQQRKILHKFELLDLDDNGLIEYADFQRVVEGLAAAREWNREDPRYQRLLTTNQNLWMALQKHCDADDDGSITPQEWLDYHGQALHSSREMDRVIPGFANTLDAFTAFIHDLLDADGDGVVTEEDYLELSRAQGLDDVDALRIFDAIDEDRDGNLTLDEVSKLVRQFYLSDDPEAPGNEFFGSL